MTEPRTTTPSRAELRLRELRDDAHRRRELLDRATHELEDGFVAEAVSDLIRVVRLLAHAEETVMQLHTECFVMIEQSRKVLELDAMSRPVQIVVPPEQNDG